MSLDTEQLGNDMLAAIKPSSRRTGARPLPSPPRRPRSLPSVQFKSKPASSPVSSPPKRRESSGTCRPAPLGPRSQRSKRSVSSPRKMPSMQRSKFCRPPSIKPSASRSCNRHASAPDAMIGTAFVFLPFSRVVSEFKELILLDTTPTWTRRSSPRKNRQRRSSHQPVQRHTQRTVLLVRLHL